MVVKKFVKILLRCDCLFKWFIEDCRFVGSDILKKLKRLLMKVIKSVMSIIRKSGF